MIQKGVKWGISDNVTVADFGNGDIIVADGFAKEEPNKGFLMLANGHARPVGEQIPEREGKSTDEIEQDIVFTFSNIESIDVVIRALGRAKAKMLEERNKNTKA